MDWAYGMGFDGEHKEPILYRYKYLPFTEGSLKIITEGTLKFTCPLDFNDPFDCMPSYDRTEIENICKIRPDLIRLAGKQLKLSPAKRLQRKGWFIQNIRRGLDSGEFVRSLVSGLGVLSLSRVATNILMWSHYASNHKGFVVELGISSDAPRNLIERIIPHPVKYTTERSIYIWGKEFDLEGYFLTKSIDWEYEQEERTLTTSEGPGVYPYSRKHFLCSVIAGARVDSEDFKQLELAVKRASEDIGRHIPLYRAEISSDKYKILIPGHYSMGEDKK